MSRYTNVTLRLLTLVTIELAAACVAIHFYSPSLEPSASANPIFHQYGTAAHVSLGQELFFDKRLSIDGTLSCAICHDPATAFADHNALAVGMDNRVATRNAPTLLNSAFSRSLFWDGRAASLEDQARQPLINPSEMGMENYDAVVERVAAVPEYLQRFKQIFGNDGITTETIVRAIAAYERTLVSINSPFDRFIAGNQKATTEAQRRGWEVFQGKARCISCHEVALPTPLFTDHKFHNTGIVLRNHDLKDLASRIQKKATGSASSELDPNVLAHTEGFSELGRFNVTKQATDIGAFKTPTLRDVELTAPYMHNGSFKTLIDVVRFYNKGGEANPHLDPEIKPLNLSDKEMNDLVDFMRALTSDEVLKLAQTTKPQTRNPVALPRRRR
jgi:cytochrome c peroxidase